MNKIVSVFVSPFRSIWRFLDPTFIDGASTVAPGIIELCSERREEVLRGLRGDIEEQKEYLKNTADEMKTLLDEP